MADLPPLIPALVGEITGEQIRFVDSFVGRRAALFIPSVGPCLYATTPDHSHPGWSFALAADDRCRVFAGGRIIAPVPGTVLAMPPGAVHHEISDDGEHARYLALFFERSFFEAQLTYYGEPVVEPFQTFIPGRELRGLLKAFMEECESRLPGSEAVVEALETALAHTLIRDLLALERPADSGAERVEIHRTIELMHARFADKLTVAELASSAGMSPSHFSRLFRRETGRPPADYLIVLRLEKARKLLLAADDSVTEIALKCGFATSSHFADAFRRRHGQSPSAWVRTRSAES